MLGEEVKGAKLVQNEDAVNVLYRRRDGTFGLLQPEMG